jgi:hypothetical protein
MTTNYIGRYSRDYLRVVNNEERNGIETARKEIVDNSGGGWSIYGLASTRRPGEDTTQYVGQSEYIEKRMETHKKKRDPVNTFYFIILEEVRSEQIATDVETIITLAFRKWLFN